jgi:hypothetical protein
MKFKELGGSDHGLFEGTAGSGDGVFENDDTNGFRSDD